MTTVRKINVSQVEGDNANNTSTDEIRPYGELAVYIGDNDKLELLMADGVRTNLRNKVLSKGTFYGGDSDSGDGEGYDTIKLVPDEELRRNGSDQYVIIDPTTGQPGHIHLRAGGTIDQSTADLFLGGELNNVRVSDTYDHVTITTDAGEGTRTWTFDNNGNLTFPDNTVQTTAWAGSTADLVSTTTASITTLSNPNNGPFVGMVSANLEGDGYIVFGPAGGTSEPDQLAGVDLTRLVGGTITEAGSGLSSPILSVTSLGNKLYSIQVEGTLATVTGGEGIGLTITVDPLFEKIWTFDTDGNVTVPGNITKTSGNLEITAENYVIIDSTNGGQIDIGANQSGEGSGDSGPILIGHANNILDIASGKLRINSTTPPTTSTGAVGDVAGLVAFSSGYLYYCTADYGQVGHQVTIATAYNDATALNTNSFQLTKTADTLQITVGDVISDSNGGATSTVVTVSSDENYTYVGTGGLAYDAVFPLTFTSTDPAYVSGGNIWKRVAWSADTW